MKRLILALVAIPCLSVPVWSQSPTENPDKIKIATNEVNATPEMWFYEQERRRYEDPQAAVREVAQQRSAQRRARIAAMKWYGMSNSRPIASPDPVHGTYSPRWVSGGFNPSLWQGPSGSVAIVNGPVAR
ncbi:MAG: hypothetical protein SGJ20_11980 [Planctomycetota bacterium]|nr:hypothetical protein [Planctomycetota bacterium]